MIQLRRHELRAVVESRLAAQQILSHSIHLRDQMSALILQLLQLRVVIIPVVEILRG
jgi:hypothetical protein